MESPFAVAREAQHKICGERISDAHSNEGWSRIWFFNDEMCFAATCHDNAAAQDFRDDLSGVAGAVHLVVRELIRGKPLRVERAKTGFIAEERPASHRHTAGKQKLNGGIEPQNRNTGISQEFRTARLSVGPAAEREDSGFLEFGSTAQGRAQLICLDLAESLLAEPLENLGDGEAGGLLDAFIQIDEAPRKLASEKRANGGLAGTHKAGQANDLSACRGATQRGWLSHCSE